MTQEHEAEVEAKERLGPRDPARQRRMKNVALLVALVALVVVIYLVSLVRMGGNAPPP